jgi:hypothetical protein
VATLIGASGANHGEEVDLGGRSLAGGGVAPLGLGAGQPGDHGALDRRAKGRGLHHGVHSRGQFGVATVAAGDVADAGLTAVQPHRGAGDGHLAHVEGVAGPAHAAPHQHQAGLRRAQRRIGRGLGQGVPGGVHLGGLRLGQDGQPIAALDVRRLVDRFSRHVSPRQVSKMLYSSYALGIRKPNWRQQAKYESYFTVVKLV